MRKLAYLLFFFAMNSTAGGDVTFEAIQVLRGKSDRTQVDGQGYKYQIFDVQKTAILQDFIGFILQNIMETSIGRAMCSHNSWQNPQVVQHHLGVSRKTAASIVNNCLPNKQFAHTTIYNSPQEDEADEHMKRVPHRRYVIAVTDRPNLPFGSWTESFNNTTLIILHHSLFMSDINLIYLTQVLAHELAIYFDTKAWPFGPAWNRLPILRESVIRAPHPDKVTLATLNPLLAPILAFIRAFKIERQIVDDLVRIGKLSNEPIYYSEKDYPFLHKSCDNKCLVNYIKKNQEWIKPITLPLLALTPHYRTRKLEQLKSLPAQDIPDFLDVAYEVLEKIPVFYMNRRANDLLALDFITNQDADFIKLNHLSANFLDQHIATQDLHELATARLSLKGNSQSYALLSYLAIPLLSDVNSPLANGPRPRIRVGSTK